MIDPKELRIGNYVYMTSDGFWSSYMVIRGLGPEKHIACDDPNDGVFYNEHYDQELMPIPLSEEILELSGFEKSDAWHQEKDITILVFRKSPMTIGIIEDHAYIFYDCEEDPWCSTTGMRIDSVHQLQNYFYALSKTELEIKLP